MWRTGYFQTWNLILHSKTYIIKQEWHSDGEHQSQYEHLPPYALNVFVALIDVKSINAPTEYVWRNFRNCFHINYCFCFHFHHLKLHLLEQIHTHKPSPVQFRCSAGGGMLPSQYLYMCLYVTITIFWYVYTITIFVYVLVFIFSFVLNVTFSLSLSWQVTFPMPAGECVIFDFRIRHRGTRNRHIPWLSC